MIVDFCELVIIALIADWLMRKCHQPGLVGMLLVGMLLGPNLLGLVSSEMLALGDEMRSVALVIILLRAGLKLNRRALNRVGLRAFMLAFLPAFLEAVTVVMLAPPLLGLDYGASILLGVVLCAISPAVVVPLMLDFIENKKGDDSDAPTMILAAASLENMIVIVVFGVLMNVYLDDFSRVIVGLVTIPASLFSGFLLGAVSGAILCFVFTRINPRATKRAMTLIALAMIFLRLEQMVDGRFPFAALPAVMALGFIILELRDDYAHEISAKLAKIWIFAEIVLFTMVGAQVDFSVAIKTGIGGLLVLAGGLLARAVGIQVCLWRGNFSKGERILVVAAAIPKGTVQAAIGATPLLMMAATGRDTFPGEIILAVAVLSILITAPIGAWAISYTGERCLRKG